MEAHLDEVGILKKLFETIQDIVGIANISVNERGLSVEAMDSSHVGLTIVHLSCKGFKKFTCQQSHTIGISFKAATKLLKLARNDDSVIIRSEHDKDKVFFEFKGKDGKKSTFDLKMLDIDAEQLVIPNAEHIASVTMDSQEWAKNMRNLSSIAEIVEIEVFDGKITFRTMGDETDGYVEIVQGKEIIIEAKEPTKQTFKLSNLVEFCKAAALSTEIVVKFYKYYPMTQNFSLDDLGYLQFHLAPKIVDDS